MTAKESAPPAEDGARDADAPAAQDGKGCCKAKCEAKRERILRAATELFAEQDYHRVLMDDVAARAAVGKGTLYR